MYEMYAPTEFNIMHTKRLLQYNIDTFGGNSGSPVIVKDDMKADDMKVIGVHVLGGNINSASVIGPLGNVFETYKGAFNAKPDPSFNIAAKVPSRDKSFRVITIPAKNQRESIGIDGSDMESSTIDKSADTESFVQESAQDFHALHSLLESSVNTHVNPDQFLGELQHLLEPSMVNAMSEACNGAQGLVKALQFLWDNDKSAPSNNEALISTLTKHKAAAKNAAKHVGQAIYDNRASIEAVGKQLPLSRTLQFGLDAASAIENTTNEGMLDHIATGLGVTAPIVEKELPKLGAIGRPVATIAGSMLRSAGASAVATLNSAVNPAASSTDAAPPNPAPTEGEVVSTNAPAPPPGVAERAVLAETALHGVMRLTKGVLKQHQVHDKIQAIIKPLAPTVRRADLMLSSLVQPTIAKVALGTIQTPGISASPSQAPQDTAQPAQVASQTPQVAAQPALDASQPVQDTPQVILDPPQTPTATTESIPFTKIGTTVTAKASDTKSALTNALVTAHPDLADALPGLVDRGLQVGNKAFADAIKFGLPTLLGDDQEALYDDYDSESPVPVPGLATRALLAEACLQVASELPVDVIESMEVPDLESTFDVFDMATPTAIGQDESGPAGNVPQWLAAAGGIGAAVGANRSATAAGTSASAATNAANSAQQSAHASTRSAAATERSAGAAERSATASEVANEHGSAASLTAHQDAQQAHKDAQKAEYQRLTRDNQDARQAGMTPPNLHLKHHGVDGSLIIPHSDAQHEGSPNHTSNGGTGRAPHGINTEPDARPGFKPPRIRTPSPPPPKGPPKPKDDDDDAAGGSGGKSSTAGKDKAASTKSCATASSGSGGQHQIPGKPVAGQQRASHLPVPTHPAVHAPVAHPLRPAPQPPVGPKALPTPAHSRTPTPTPHLKTPAPTTVHKAPPPKPANKPAGLTAHIAPVSKAPIKKAPAAAPVKKPAVAAKKPAFKPAGKVHHAAEALEDDEEGGMAEGFEDDEGEIAEGFLSGFDESDW